MRVGAGLGRVRAGGGEDLPPPGEQAGSPLRLAFRPWDGESPRRSASAPPGCSGGVRGAGPPWRRRVVAVSLGSPASSFSTLCRPPQPPSRFRSPGAGSSPRRSVLAGGAGCPRYSNRLGSDFPLKKSRS